MKGNDLTPAIMSVLLLLGIVVFAFVRHWRIAIEERTLFGVEGYSDFAKGRKRLFPGIW